MVSRSPDAPSRRSAGPPTPLRLTGRADAVDPPRRHPRPRGHARPTAGPPRDAGQPLLEPTDPRWVLAVRTAEQLEGTLLRPERRQRLVRLGKLLGLSPFEANLVIAVVQDQARRGYTPTDCPAAGEAQLRLIPRPPRATITASLTRRPWLSVGLALVTLMLLELLLLRILFF